MVAADTGHRYVDESDASYVEPKIIAEDPDRPRFFAIGVGHLPGAGGLVALLRAKGYVVRRVQRFAAARRELDDKP